LSSVEQYITAAIKNSINLFVIVVTQSFLNISRNPRLHLRPSIWCICLQ
jgi:hypothetical protein